MKKILLAGVCAVALTGAAFAQNSQPQGGANQSPTSSTADSNKDGMKGGKMGSELKNGAMKNDNAAQGTTGAAGTSHGATTDTKTK